MLIMIFCFVWSLVDNRGFVWLCDYSEAGGCEHFTCPKCRTEFCRICSNYFYNPTHNTVDHRLKCAMSNDACFQRCPRPNCLLVNTVHAHCAVNCYREIRDAGIDRLLEFLEVSWSEDGDSKHLLTLWLGERCRLERRVTTKTCFNWHQLSCQRMQPTSFWWKRKSILRVSVWIVRRLNSWVSCSGGVSYSSFVCWSGDVNWSRGKWFGDLLRWTVNGNKCLMLDSIGKYMKIIICVSDWQKLSRISLKKHLGNS